MKSLKCNDQRAFSYSCVGTYNAKPVQKSSITTESSSGSSTYVSRVWRQMNDVPDTSCEKLGMELLLDYSVSKSECSMLTADHETTSNAKVYNISKYSDIEGHQKSFEPTKTELIGGDTMVNDDSFFNSCEVDVESLDDDSTCLDDEAQLHISISRRGRSMSIDDYPKPKNNETIALAPSKNFQTSHRPAPKKHSKHSRRSYSLPPKARTNEISEELARQSRCSRSKRRIASPRRVFSAHKGDHRTTPDTKEKPYVTVTPILPTPTKGDIREKVRKQKCNGAMTHDSDEGIIRENRKPTSRNDSSSHGVTNYKNIHCSNKTVMLTQANSKTFQHHGKSRTAGESKGHENKAISPQKGKMLNRSHSLQPEDYHPTQQSMQNRSTNRQSRRHSSSMEYEIQMDYNLDSSSNDQKIKTAIARRSSYSSLRDNIHRHTPFEDGAHVQSSKGIISENRDDRPERVSRVQAVTSVGAIPNIRRDVNEVKGRRVSLNRLMSSEMDELFQCHNTNFNLPMVKNRSTRRNSLSGEYRDGHKFLSIETKAKAHSGTPTTSFSPRNEMVGLIPQIKAECRMLASNSHCPNDPISPITLNSEIGIISYEKFVPCPRQNDGKEMLVQDNLDTRWRAEANHPSPRRPSRQLLESDENASPICRNIIKYQSFPESPTRRSRPISTAINKYSVPENVDQNKPTICMQPIMGRNQPSTTLSVHHQSGVKLGSNAAHQRKRSNSAPIDNEFQRQRDSWESTETNQIEIHRNNFGVKVKDTSHTSNVNYQSPTKASRRLVESGLRHLALPVPADKLAIGTNTSETTRKSTVKKINGNERFI